MKNLIVYLFFAFVPFFLVIWSLSFGSMIFTISLFLFYIYRAIIDGIRLNNKGILQKKDIWKSFIPCYKIGMYKELYSN